MDESKSKNIEVFEKMPVAKAVQTMAIPTIISQLIVLIYNIADTFFVGRTNNPYMVAGASLILPIFNMTIVIFNLAGAGGGSLISRLLGIKEYEEARKVYSFSVYLALLISALFSLGVFIFMNPLMRLLGAGNDTYQYASTYAFLVVVCGGVPTVLSNTLSTLIRSVGESAKAGFGITLGGIINIILDPIFMFVLFPKGMEITGAGFATCLSNIIACIYFFTVIFRLRDNPVLHLNSPTNLPTEKSIKSALGVGFPSALATFLFDIDYIVIDRLMSGYNAIALAAIGIVLKVERLPLNVGIGICQGMLPIVAYNYSAQNYERMDACKNYSLKLGLICSIISIALYEIFAGPIMRIFIGNAETVTLGTYFLRVRVLATPLMFVSFFYVYLFNAFGEGKYALLLGIVRWLFLNIPMLFLLDRIIGMNGLVWAQVTADILNVSFSILVFNYYRKHHFGFAESK